MLTFKFEFDVLNQGKN